MLKSNMFNIDDQQTIGDGDQILLCYKNDGRLGKISVLFINKQILNSDQKEPPTKNTHFI